MSWRCSSRCPGCCCSAGLWYVAWIWRECYDWYGDWLLMMDIGYSIWLPMITDDYSTDDWLLMIVMIHHLSDLSIWNSKRDSHLLKSINLLAQILLAKQTVKPHTCLPVTFGLDVLDGLSHRQSVSSNDGLRVWTVGIYSGKMAGNLWECCGNLWESPRKTNCLWIYRTVEMSSTETRLKYVEMLIGIRTVGWMLFFTSSLARFNLGKCVIRGLRCGQSLAQ